MYKQTATQFRPVLSTLVSMRSPWFCQTIGTYQNPNDPDDERKPTEFELRLAEDKAKLKWRIPYFEKKEEWYTKFKSFSKETNENIDIIAMFQRPIDFSVQGYKDRKERKRVKIEKFMQQFVPQRHQMLGNDLAAAHFLLYRGGSVKYVS